MSAPVVVARAAATRTGATAGTRAGTARKAGAGAGKRRAAAKVSQAERERRAAAEAFEAAAADPAPAEPAAEPAAAPTSSTRRSSTSSGPGWATSQAGAPRWWRKTVDADAVSASNAGGGFLLGLGLYWLGLAYLRGGGPEVKRLLRAKFLNKVDGQ